MRHNLLITLLTATIPLFLGGCFFLGGEDTATAPSPDPTVPSTTVAVPNTTIAAAPNTTASPAGVLPPDLIGSTNSAQRVQGIQRNRPDPFALISTTPSVEIPANQTASQPVPQLPNLPSQNNQPNSPGSTAANPSSSRGVSVPLRPGTQGGSGSLAPIPLLVPNTTVSIAPPPRPQPDLARAVKVTGVVQIGTTLNAIVSAPNEPSSRYVRVGQRLSNGQILVKRIEMQGSEPIVVLEQNGIEVNTAVGSGGAPSQPTAMTLVSDRLA